MSSKARTRSRKGGASKNKPQAEFPMKGKGVEVLEIPAIEQAANEVLEVRKQIADLKELLDPAVTRLTTAMEENADKLPKDADTGSRSYRFGNTLVTLPLKKCRVTIKTIRDTNPNPIADNG